MPGLDLPASMVSQLKAIADRIRNSYAQEIKCGRSWVEAALESGEWLTKAKKVISLTTPHAWPRWCLEEVHFSPKTIQTRIRFWSKFDALSEEKQAHLLGSTESIRGAMRLLESDTVKEQVARKRASISGQEVTDPDPETGISTPRTPVDDLPADDDEPESEPSVPPVPDPWKSTKAETSKVFALVNEASEALRVAVALARGFPGFSFVGSLENELQTIKLTLRLSKPTELCPKCRPEVGPEAAKTCRHCHSFGLVPKSIASRGT